MKVNLIHNSSMYITVFKVRRINLLALFVESELSKQDFAHKIGISPSYLSQLFTLDEEKRRNIGDKFAREIEIACGKLEGWLDTRHDMVFDEAAEPVPSRLVGLLLATRDFIAKSGENFTPEETEKLYRAALNAGFDANIDPEKLEEYLKYFLPINKLI